VNLDPAHYLSGRWFLLAQGLVLIGLSLTALIQHWAGAPGTPDGVAVLWLRLTPLHAWVLLVFGVAAVAATPWRRAATAVAAAGVAGFLLLFAIGTPAAANATAGARGPGLDSSAWGMDLGDTTLHVGLLIYNLVLVLWLATTAIQGPVWVRRRQTKRNRATEVGSSDGSRATAKSDRRRGPA
jgi:hypothetical protein